MSGYFKRLSRNSCETCQKELFEHQFGTWQDIMNPERIVSFCSYECLEYFLDYTKKETNIKDHVLHTMPDIEDN